MSLNEILPKLHGVRECREGFVAYCPAHDDNHRSLSIGDTDSRTLLHCFAGCPTIDVLKKIGLGWESTFHQAKKPSRQPIGRLGNYQPSVTSRKIAAVYRYTDETGQLLYENVRFEPKGFAQRTVDKFGNHSWKLDGVRRVPYRLHKILPCIRFGAEVWFAEGEKDAETLAELGFTSTSFKNWSPEFNKYIQNCHAVLLRDHDIPGGHQAEEAARVISAAASSVKIIDVHSQSPTMPEKHGPDISDYVFECVRHEGMTREEIAERLSLLADGAQLWVDPAKSRQKTAFLIKGANDWVDEAKTRPNPKQLFDKFWFEGELCILFADTNVGKSILAVQIGDAISKGVSDGIAEVTCEPKRVVYLDFELTDKQFESRVSEKREGTDECVNHYRFHENFLRAELDPDTDMGAFGTFEEFLNFSLERAIVDNKADVMIVDNLTYLRDETENARNALPLMKYLKELKKKYGVSILALAHTPKRDSSKPLGRNDLQGSKMLINFCDSSFAIGESQRDEGLRYLKQIKARNTPIVYHSENVMLCNLVKIDNLLRFDYVSMGTEREHLKTQTEKDKDKTIAKVKELAAGGMSQREIAKQVGVSQMTVSRYLKSESP